MPPPAEDDSILQLMVYNGTRPFMPFIPLIPFILYLAVPLPPKGLMMLEKLVLDVIVPSIPVILEFMVPVLDDAALLSKASALSNTSLENKGLYVPLCGVLGTVACTAGPRAALAGVIAIGAELCTIILLPIFTPLDELLADI